MSKTHFARRLLLAATLFLSSTASLTAHADEALNHGPAPAAWAAVMAAKDPSHFGPHLPAADAPSGYAPPAAGSTAALLSAKDPSRYGPHPAAAGQDAAAPTRNAWQALVLAKDPMFFKRGTKAEDAVMEMALTAAGCCREPAGL